jgi:hypothetical protein
MDRTKYQRLERVRRHCLTGVGIGSVFGVVVSATDAGTFYSAMAGTYGGVGALLHLVVGFSLLIGVGAGFTGALLDECDQE